MISKIKQLLFIGLITIFFLEIGLSIGFYFKDRKLTPIDTRDFPYTYYTFKKNEVVNEHGLKTDKQITKPEGHYRVVLLGGSVARSQGPVEHSISFLLEKELNRHFKTDKVEVINAGISGFVVEQEFIFLQMVLQHYEPDVIIGLDGFNDLYSFYLNRRDPAYAHSLPHNWKDFKVIQQNRYRKSFFSRFTGFFKGITRFANYLKSQSKDPDANIYDQFEPFVKQYWQVVEDIRDFCSVNQIQYVHFFQPTRDYRSIESYIFDQQYLDKLYANMEKETEYISYAYSLTRIFDEHPELFTDFVHVNSEGNHLFVQHIAEILAPFINEEFQAEHEDKTKAIIK